MYGNEYFVLDIYIFLMKTIKVLMIKMELIILMQNKNNVQNEQDKKSKSKSKKIINCQSRHSTYECKRQDQFLPQQNIRQNHQVNRLTKTVNTLTQRIPLQQLKSPFFQSTSEKTIKLKQQQLKKLTEQKSKTQNKLKLLSDRQFQLRHQYKTDLKNRYFNKKQNINERSMIGSRTIDMKRSPLQDSKFDNQFLQLQIPSLDLQVNKSSSLNKLRPKSQLTVEDIQKLKKLKNQYVKFQQQLAIKTKKHNQELQKIKIQNIQLQQLIKKQKNIQKRNEIQIKLQQLEKQKLQRIQKFQHDQIKLKEVKRKPKIHQKIVKQFQEKQKAINQQKLQKMKQRLKKKALDVSQINQHQKNYQYQRNQQLKLIQQKYLQQSRVLKESKVQPEKVSRFYRSVIQEQQQRKNERKRKELATIQKCERIKEYAAKVYQEHYPRIKTKQNDEEDEVKSQQHNDRSLSIQERKQLGNDYLRIAIKSLKQQQKNKSQLTTNESTSKQSQLPKISSLSTKYKDYLNEQRSRYKSDIERSHATQQKLKQKYMQSVQQVKKIINEDINVRNKHKTIQKIQKITQRMQHQPNDKNYLQKIRAKLKILQTIT